jgi:hypothetical protein
MLDKNGLEDCIQSCWATRHMCQKTLFEHCLQKGGDHVAPTHVELMISCIEICQTAADFMTRSSALHTSVCAACANVCEACADSCETIMCDDKPCPEMQRCADACRATALSCRTMGQEGVIPVEQRTGQQPQA